MSYINVCVHRTGVRELPGISELNEIFQAEVNKKISEGYTPIGGVSHLQILDNAYTYSGFSFSQAMYMSDP
jgi:hypothetical protein